MTDKTMMLKRNDSDFSRLVQLVSEGYSLLCPVCKSEVLVIDTEEKMKLHKSSRGARCSQDDRHYGFYLIEKRKSDFLQDLARDD